MKRLHALIPLLLFTIMSLLGVFLYQKISSDQYIYNQNLLQMHKDEQKNMEKLRRIARLETFMSRYKSPLYPYARHIVEEAMENGIDYRLLVAIAMNESTLCKAIPQSSYNCWGWGIYGDKVTRFTSYDDAISVISRGLKRNYYDRGMASPGAIMRVYTPSSPDGIWARKIHKWFEEIGE